MRQLVQQSFAFRPRGHRLQDFPAQLAQVVQPRSQIRRELRVDLAPQALRQRRTLTRGRNSNLQVAPLHDRTEEEVAQRRIVRGVAQDRAARGFFKDGLIDLAIIGGRNDEIATGRVLGLIAASQPLDLSP